LLISVVGLISGCKNEPPKNDDAVLAQKNFEPRKPTDPPLNVLATTGMIADAVRKVGGDSIKVNALMGPGVDPHLYKPNSGDLTLLNNASIIFYNGLHLEGKMTDVLTKIGRNKPVVAVANGIPQAQYLSGDMANSYDPHIWMDAQLWVGAVYEISNQLQALDPINANFFRMNATRYIDELNALHRTIIEKMAQIPADQRLLITSHDAFKYFGRAYKIEVKGLQGISTVAEFGLRDVSNMVQLIVQRNIKAIFVETSVAQKPIEAVLAGCLKQNHKVVIGGTLFSDALGNANTPEGTYIGMMRFNATVIANALK
jgi:manganese/zinc/iron transport system substrate-binding protein